VNICHIVAFEGNSTVTLCDSSLSEYEVCHRETRGKTATRPRRITYRNLTRWDWHAFPAGVLPRGQVA